MGYISDLRKTVGHKTLIMPCACLIIGDGKGNILLQKRSDDGNWGYHGGAVEIDESIEAALLREIREELDVVPENPKLFGVYSGDGYHHVYPNKDEVSCIDIVYTTDKIMGEIKFSDGEVSEVGWFNKDTLPENLSDSCRRPISDYFSSFHGLNK